MEFAPQLIPPFLGGGSPISGMSGTEPSGQDASTNNNVNSAGKKHPEPARPSDTSGVNKPSAEGVDEASQPLLERTVKRLSRFHRLQFVHPDGRSMLVSGKALLALLLGTNQLSHRMGELGSWVAGHSKESGGKTPQLWMDLRDPSMPREADPPDEVLSSFGRAEWVDVPQYFFSHRDLLKDLLLGLSKDIHFSRKYSSATLPEIIAGDENRASQAIEALQNEGGLTSAQRRVFFLLDVLLLPTFEVTRVSDMSSAESAHKKTRPAREYLRDWVQAANTSGSEDNPRSSEDNPRSSLET
jgi:hypothetical protein